MDASDRNRLAAHAKREGRVLVAWARETLLHKIAPLPKFKHLPASNLKQTLDAATVRNIHELGLPQDDAPTVHTASSNRLTCMCATCSAYRKAHDIPLGGAKREKK
jgi:hypothetical protein